MKKMTSLFILLFFLTSCRIIEIEQYDLVSCFGVDYKDEEVVVSSEFFKIKQGNSTEEESVCYETKGKNLDECLERLNLMSEKKINMSHCKLIIIGEEYAKRGVEELFDYILHDPTVRLTVEIIVCKEEASKIIGIENDDIKIVSRVILGILENNKNDSDVYSKGVFYQCANQILDAYSSIVLPVCYMEDKNIFVEGAAIFKGYSLEAFLTNNEANTIKLLNNELTEGGYAVNSEIKPTINTSKIDKEITKERVSFRVKLTLYFYKQVNGYDMSNANDLFRLKSVIEEELKQKAEKNALKLLQEGLDPFGLIKDLYRYKTKLYNEVIDEYEEFLRNLEVAVSIQTTILTPSFSSKEFD